MAREKFIERKIILANAMTQETALQVIKNAPIDPFNPLEVIVREWVKARKQDQNSLMWAGPLKDIAEQAWARGRRYKAEVWHEYCTKGTYYFIKGRLKFGGHNNSAPFPSVIVIFSGAALNKLIEK